MSGSEFVSYAQEKIYELAESTNEGMSDDALANHYKDIYQEIQGAFDEGRINEAERDEALDVFDEVGAPDLSLYWDGRP